MVTTEIFRNARQAGGGAFREPKQARPASPISNPLAPTRVKGMKRSPVFLIAALGSSLALPLAGPSLAQRSEDGTGVGAGLTPPPIDEPKDGAAVPPPQSEPAPPPLPEPPPESSSPPPDDAMPIPAPDDPTTKGPRLDPD